MADSHPPRLGTNDRARAHDPDHKADLVAQRRATEAADELVLLGQELELDTTPAGPRGRHEKETDA